MRSEKAHVFGFVAVGVAALAALYYYHKPAVASSSLTPGGTVTDIHYPALNTLPIVTGAAVVLASTQPTGVSVAATSPSIYTPSAANAPGTLNTDTGNSPDDATPSPDEEAI